MEVGTRVELIPEMAGVYKKAVPGAVGEVIAKKVDEGFAMVYIEWDESHWRYNGEPDGWTFESHFTPTEKTNIFEALEDPKAFADNLAERVTELSLVEGESEEERDEALEVYLDQLNEVVSLLSESNGFIVLAARDEVHPKDPEKQIIVPYVFGSFLNQETALLLETQVIQVGGQTQIEMAQKILRNHAERDEDE